MKFVKFFIIFIALFFSIKVFAANLDISPNSQNASTGDIVSVSVTVSTSGQAINAVSGVLSFPKNLLEVTSISATGSIVNFWATEPKFSNSAGTVTFEGVIMSPGFTGNNGRVIKINFKAKSTGNANLQFDTTSILANDGSGTELASGKGSATLTIKEKKLPEPKVVPIEQKVEPVAQTPTPPVLSSPELKIATPEVKENIPIPIVTANPEPAPKTSSIPDGYLMFSVLGIFSSILLIFVVIYQHHRIRKLKNFIKHNRIKRI